MELSQKQQIVELFKKSDSILLVTHKNPGGDAIGSLIALDRILVELGKKPQIVVSETIPASLTFLPGTDRIKTEVEGNRDLVIKVEKGMEIEKLLTKVEETTLYITLTSRNNSLEESQISVTKSKPKYDCIVVLDTPDVDKIDRLYDQNTDLFFETPIINIDHHGGNEYFGTINLVELTATSTAEILVSIIEALGKTKLDEDTATCLLAGITSDTASFKSINTTPKSLTVAAQLLAAGARQQEIIQNFYKTKSLKTLKLWGKTLMSLRSNPELRIVWSSIRYKDFADSGVSPEEAREVLDDLLANTPGADVVCLIMEAEPGIFSIKLKGIKGSDVLEIAEAFGGSGHSLSAGFEIKNVAFEAAEFQVLKTIQDIRGKKIGRVVQEKKIEPLFEKEGTPTSEGGSEEVEIKVIEEKTPKSKDEVGSEVRTKNSLESLDPIRPDQASDQAAEKDGGIEKENLEKSNQKDAITRALESLEASKTTEEREELIAAEDSRDHSVDSLTPISEIIKKFTPGQIKEDGDNGKSSSV